eukprot:TRINITY_DN1705_c0_g1_i2.p1 TRINITY_DN1705_c0_g1~~TRINITY_DN1705_c0_g1_i2.p1  ORF type:complete len:267 (-),score=51.07 TRINITY_DN1705_c0_g1_i2:99-899(-)
MPRGPKKHLKRLNAPSHWMLDKMSGTYAPRPNAGPHKLRECLPIIILLRNRLKYALTKREVQLIVMQKLIKVDGKVRTDAYFPTGFMDVVEIQKTNEFFRLLYDTKGRFFLKRIDKDQARYKFAKVRRVQVGPKGIPFLSTHDSKTFRYPDPDIKVNDTVKIDLKNNKIVDFVRFETGNLCMITGGRNLGRVGVIEHREKHQGSFDIVHVKDASGASFATRLTNVFIIGKGTTSWVSLPSKKGVKSTIQEEQQHRNRALAKKAHQK